MMLARLFVGRGRQAREWFNYLQNEGQEELMNALINWYRDVKPEIVKTDIGKNGVILSDDAGYILRINRQAGYIGLFLKIA